MTENIFTALSEYEKDENYWTAALLYVLEYLWRDTRGSEIQRAAYASFLSDLCDIPFGVNEEGIDFQIQKEEKGTQDKSRIVVDARIMSDTKYVGIEVKDASGFNQEPRDYKRCLREAADRRECRLVLLRRSRLSPIDSRKAKRYVDNDVRWFKVYKWMEELKSKLGTDDTSGSQYLLEQFLEFLNEKGVPIMTKVTEEGLTNGLKQIPSLLNMVWQWAESTFEERELKAVLTTDYVDTDVIGFLVGDRRGARGEECYAFEIIRENPPSLSIAITEEALRRIEGKNINQSKLQQLQNQGKLDIDARGWICAYRPLTTVFQGNTEEEQCDEVASLLEEMLRDLDSIKLKR